VKSAAQKHLILLALANWNRFQFYHR